MKILFCPTHYVLDETRGSEIYTSFSIVNKLARIFKDSIVVVGKNLVVNPGYKVVEVYKKKGELDVSVFSAIIFSILYTFACFKQLRKNKFDIIHHVRPFKFGSTFNLIPILGLNKDIPFVVGPFCSQYKEVDPVSLKKGFGVKVKDFLNKFVLKIVAPVTMSLSIKTIQKASKVLVYDEFTKSQLLPYVSAEKIAILPPGKDGDVYANDVSRDYAQKALEFITVGYLIKRKRIDLLLHSFQKVAEKFPEARLRIVGDGPERENLEHLAKKLAIAENVIFSRVRKKH